jgi:acyl carrier protein
MSAQAGSEGSVATRVIAVIAKTQRIPIETVTLDSSFEDLKIDSLDGINIIFAIESEFGINIPDDGVQSLKTVRQVVDGVEDLLQQKVNTPAPGVA